MQTPQVKVPVPLRLPPLQMPIASCQSPVLLINRLWPGSSHAPFFGFDNLVDWLTDSGMVHLVLLVHEKGYNLGKARWKRCIGQKLLCCLWACLRNASSKKAGVKKLPPLASLKGWIFLLHFCIFILKNPQMTLWTFWLQKSTLATSCQYFCFKANPLT